VASHQTYELRILAKLQRECREKFKDYRNARRELKQVRLNMIELQDRLPIDEASIEAMAIVDQEISWHRLSLELANCNLQCVRGFLQNMNVETELKLLETYKRKEAEE
jgi:hypothetical protein